MNHRMFCQRIGGEKPQLLVGCPRHLAVDRKEPPIVRSIWGVPDKQPSGHHSRPMVSGVKPAKGGADDEVAPAPERALGRMSPAFSVGRALVAFEQDRD